MIREALDDADLAAVRTLFREYADGLGVDLSFQGFEEELASLPGAYARPRGRLLIAEHAGEIRGCVAMRPLGLACEMKRLYVRPSARGTGLGTALVAAIVAAARDSGYAAMRLDTLPTMASARAMYAAFGFREIAPYRHNPVAGTSFLELPLAPSSPPAPRETWTLDPGGTPS